jgi:hypothetical protein
MEEERDKFAVINEIYSKFTEENKEKLVKTAKNLLKVQKEDLEMVVDAKPQKEGLA